jgi:hypothetical protein
VARTMRHRQIPDDSDVDAEFRSIIREHYAYQGRPIATAATCREPDSAICFRTTPSCRSMGTC